MVPLTTASLIRSVTAVMDSITAVVGVHTLMAIGTLELIGHAVVHYNRQTAWLVEIVTISNILSNPGCYFIEELFMKSVEDGVEWKNKLIRKKMNPNTQLHTTLCLC